MANGEWKKFNIEKLNGNPEVITFIDNILRFGDSENENNSIQDLFTNGYCYYFAVILKDAFNRGEICWNRGKGHIVWEDEDGISYDINGVYDPEGEGDIVPVETSLGRMIDDFKHVKEYRVKLPEFHDWISETPDRYDATAVSKIYTAIPKDELVPELTVEENATLYWLNHLKCMNPFTK